MKRGIIALLMLIISMLFFYFFIIPSLNTEQFLESLNKTDLTLYILALFFILISNAFAALRWSVLMDQAGAKKSHMFFNAFGIFSLGQASGLIVPTRVGSYSKAPLVMKLDNLSYETALAAVNAETIIDMIYICCAGLVSLLIVSVLFSSHFYLSAVVIIIIIICLTAVFVVFWQIHSFQGAYENMCAISSSSEKGITVKIPARILGKLYELIVTTKDIFSQKAVVAKLGIFTLVTQLLGVFGFLLVIKSTHTTLPLIYVFAILTLSFLVGIISLIPGGLGASDLSMIVLLENAGIALPVATNIALLWRFAMYLPILAVSGIYLAKIHLYPKKNLIKGLFGFPPN